MPRGWRVPWPVQRNNPKFDGARFEKDVEAALLAAENRARLRPETIRYPAELPVVQAKDELITAIRDHQVVVVCGETGSGKTTQLPKLCLELGRGTRGLIGHTQPRRLAARSVANRIAAELDGKVGELVGFETRFDRRMSERSLIKLMTDGHPARGTQPRSRTAGLRHDHHRRGP